MLMYLFGWVRLKNNILGEKVYRCGKEFLPVQFL